LEDEVVFKDLAGKEVRINSALHGLNFFYKYAFELVSASTTNLNGYMRTVYLRKKKITPE